jgi:hypothetical protein
MEPVMKHFPPPPPKPSGPGGNRLELRHWLVIAASLLSALALPFLLVLWLERR